MLGTYHLNVLYDVLKDLHFLYERDKIHSYLLENLAKALNADAASLFITDAKRENLILKACIGPKQKMLELIAEELPFPVEKGICGWTAKYNQPIVVDNVQQDPRFNSQVDTLTGYRTKSVLCAPISNKDEVLGVIEVLNKQSSAFNKNDMDLVALIARQTAIALENGRLVQELNRVRQFSEGILNNLTSGFIAVDAQGTVTHFNPAAEKILVTFSGDCLEQDFEKTLAGYPEIVQAIRQTLDSKEAQFRKELNCQRPNKTFINLGYSTCLIQDKQKTVLGVAFLFQDLTGAVPV